MNSAGVTLRIHETVEPSDDINILFDEIEIKAKVKFDEPRRESCYRDFYERADPSNEIRLSDAHEILEKYFERRVGESEFREILKRLNDDTRSASISGDESLDFRGFITVLAEIQKSATVESEDSVDSIWLHKIVPIDPESSVKQAWDFLVIVFLVYSVFEASYKLTFSQSEAAASASPTFPYDVFLDVLFMIDVLLCFLTSYYDAMGLCVRDMRSIARRYARTWFLPDLGGSFPFDKVIQLFMTSAENVGTMRVLKLVRMLKLLRAVKVFKRLGELGRKEGFEWLKLTLGIFRSVLLLVFCAHLLGCVFTLIFVESSRKNWMYAYNADLKDADEWQRYIVALYWAIISITTMGYGDIVPVTLGERLFCVFVAIAGAVIFSYCMGTISSLISTVDGVEYKVSKKLQDVADYVGFRVRNLEVQRVCRSFFSLSWRKTGGLYDEQGILRELPTHLRRAVLREIGANSREYFKMLQGFDDECIGLVVTRLRPVRFNENESIYLRGDPADEMFLLCEGEVELYLDNPDPVKVLRGSCRRLDSSEAYDVMKEGDVFGESGLFPGAGPAVREDAAAARTMVVAFSLRRESMRELEDQCPKLWERLRILHDLRLENRRILAREKGLNQYSGSRNMFLSCSLERSVDQLQRSLLSMKEKTLLLPQCGTSFSQLLSLFVLAEGEGNRLVNISCALTDCGELLYIENSPKGVTLENPRSLGFFVSGLSSYTMLSKVQVDDRLGSKKGKYLQLLGLDIVLFRSQIPGSRRSDEGMTISLFTLFDENFRKFWTFLRGLKKVQQSPMSSPLRRGIVSPSSSGSPHKLLGRCIEQDIEAQRIPKPHGIVDCRAQKSSVLHGYLDHRKFSLEWFCEHVEWVVETFENLGGGDAHCYSLLLELLHRHTGLLASLSQQLTQDGALDSLQPASGLGLTKLEISSRIHSSLPRESQMDEVVSQIHESSRIQSPLPRESRMNEVLPQMHDGNVKNNQTGMDSGMFSRRSGSHPPVLPLPCRNVPCLKVDVDNEYFEEIGIAQSSHIANVWHHWTERLQKIKEAEDSRTLSQNLLTDMPDEILALFDEVQASKSLCLDESERVLCFRGFNQEACGAQTINICQATGIMQNVLHLNIEDSKLQDIIFNSLGTAGLQSGLLDFRDFLYLSSEVMINRNVIAVESSFSARVLNFLVPINPDGLSKKLWDALVILLLIYSMFDVPYKLTFADASESSPIVFGFDVCMDAIFMIDVLLSFFTAYYDTLGVCVRDLRSIRRKYLQTWFLPDIMGSFPFDKVIQTFLTSADSLSALRGLKVVRLLKLLRAARVFKRLNEMSQKEGFEWLKLTLGIFRSILLILYCAHLLGCFFTMLFVDDSSKNWMYAYNAELEFADNWERYITALYWAVISITTMGYGDVKPVAQGEYLFCIAVALSGAVIFSYCMGTISSLLTPMLGIEDKFVQKLQCLKDYLFFRRIPEKLRHKIESFYWQLKRNSSDLYQEQPILRELPTHLRRAVLREIGANSREYFKMLQGFDDECIGLVVTRLQRVLFNKSETIYLRGDPADEMFLLCEGEVELYLDNPDHVKASIGNSEAVDTFEAYDVMKEGDVFGESGLFPGAGPAVREDAAAARTMVVAFSLRRESMRELEDQCPKLLERLSTLCSLRMEERRLRRSQIASSEALIADVSGSPSQRLLQAC